VKKYTLIFKMQEFAFIREQVPPPVSSRQARMDCLANTSAKKRKALHWISVHLLAKI
jgi:hypothetical protein